MSRRLDDLDPRFRPLAIELLARLVEAKIPVLIVDTLRTAAEHQANLIAGVSWTQNSLHLRGLAIDIVPYSVFELHGMKKLAWSTADPIWQDIGLIGEKLGLRWGGRWTQKDLSHFEYVTPTGVTLQEV